MDVVWGGVWGDRRVLPVGFLKRVLLREKVWGGTVLGNCVAANGSLEHRGRSVVVWTPKNVRKRASTSRRLSDDSRADDRKQC